MACLRAANVMYAKGTAVATAVTAPACSRPRGANAAPAMPALKTRASSPKKTVRSGAVFILSPKSSPSPMANAPNLNRGRSRRASWPGVRLFRSLAAAMLAIGVMDLALATAPINAEESKPGCFIFLYRWRYRQVHRAWSCFYWLGVKHPVGCRRRSQTHCAEGHRPYFYASSSRGELGGRAFRVGAERLAGSPPFKSNWPRRSCSCTAVPHWCCSGRPFLTFVRWRWRSAL